MLVGASAAKDMSFWITMIVFILTYGMIIYDKIHRTIVAIFGASLLLILGIVSQEEAFFSTEIGVDWDVIFLLISVTIVIIIIKPTGFFEYIAIKSAKLVKGEPIGIMAIFCTISAVVSAFLPNNATTVMLIGPVTLLLCEALKIDGIPFLIAEAIAANIGGTGTPIGDPSIMMIASKSHLNLMAFIKHVDPLLIIILIVYILTLRFVFKKRLQTSCALKQRIMTMDEKAAIKNPALLKKCLIIFVLTLIGFLFGGFFNIRSATIGLLGAGVLLMASGIKDPNQIFAEIDWGMIFFFIGLFIINGAAVKVGLIKWVAVKVLAITNGNMFVTSMLVLWFSAFGSAFLDNLPYIATMTPLIVDMAKELWPHLSGTQLLHHPELIPVWLSLIFGACLGGNGTMIGATANFVACSLAEKIGRPISYKQYMMYGMPLMIESVIVSTIYIWLRYYVF
jgi:Na+/H+ antiporter NhaD/arsenite permease-like protein